MAAITLKFTFEKETKNAVRYQEVLPDGVDRGVVGNVYILKTNLKDTFGETPKSIEVTISKGD